MNTAIEWLKAVSASFVGDEYEPFVKLLTVVVIAAVAGKFLVGLLSRPPMITLIQWVWSLLKEADTAFKYKTEYAPEMERIRRRVAPYGDLVMHAILAAVATLWLIAVFFVALIIAVRPSASWYALIFVLAFLGVVLPWWRCHIASASWAWHAIKTGEERPPRTPQLCDTLIKRLDRDIAKPETKVSQQSVAVLPDQSRST